MAASAVSISNVVLTAKNVENEGGSSSVLTVTFNVNQRGFAHVAGIIVSTNGWATRQEVIATWQQNVGSAEQWQATFRTSGTFARFAFVCWCEDYSGNDTLTKIWNTNSGAQYWATASD